MYLRFLKIAIFLFAVVGVLRQEVHAEFPERTVKIVVYTDPGGLIDITARQAAHILQKKYVSVPVVVENKKGAGGLVALSHLLSQPADGHTIFGFTNSVVSRISQAKQDAKLDELYYIARMVEDYECLITNSKKGHSSLDQVIAEAKQNQGKQIWLGPAKGGTDYLFALKFWERAGIKGKWIPYRGGNQAITALMGGHGSVYVGNPQDTVGRPDLKIVAVAAPERLANFSDSPTFAELGMPELSGEVLWRGFAVRKEVPAQVKNDLTQLFEKLSRDSDWEKFIKRGNVEPVFDSAGEFYEVIKAQLKKDKKYLS